MKKRLTANITGKVQMVMYRDFVQRKASGLGLSGSVRNKDDGSVVVVAEGEEEDLEELIERLHKGPFLARVRDVKLSWSDATSEFKGFKIEY